MKFHNRSISGNRGVPPRWKIVAEERDYRSPTDRYLAQVDASLREERNRVQTGGSAPDDIVGIVVGTTR